MHRQLAHLQLLVNIVMVVEHNSTLHGCTKPCAAPGFCWQQRDRFLRLLVWSRQHSTLQYLEICLFPLAGASTATLHPGCFVSVLQKRGNVIKVDRHKYVKVAYHGFAQLSSEQRNSVYNHSAVRDDFEEPNYAMIDTLFSLAEAYLFMQLVELVVSRAERVLEGRAGLAVFGPSHAITRIHTCTSSPSHILSKHTDTRALFLPPHALPCALISLPLSPLPQPRHVLRYPAAGQARQQAAALHWVCWCVP